jgi:predicted anti-sigma-YlaC factor YlaD
VGRSSPVRTIPMYAQAGTGSFIQTHPAARRSDASCSVHGPYEVNTVVLCVVLRLVTPPHWRFTLG